VTVLTDTQVVTASGGLVELGYGTNVADTTITAGNNSVLIGPITVVCDGSPVLVDVFYPRVDTPTNGDAYATIELDSVSQGRAISATSPVGLTFGSEHHGQIRLTPSAGSHTFQVRGYANVASGVFRGASASGFPAAFLRVSKIVQATQWPAVTTGTIICTSSTRPASPFAGQQIYETDTSLSYTYSGSAWVQTGNLGAWTTFTPQLRTGTTNVASTNNYGRYTIVGKTVTAQAKVTATAVGVASNAIKLSIPTGTAVSGVDATIGTYFVKDTGTAYYTGAAAFVETGYVSGQAYNSADNMGANTPAMTIAVGDVVSYAVVYEIA